jgi:hypothetical protein
MKQKLSTNSSGVDASLASTELSVRVAPSPLSLAMHPLAPAKPVFIHNQTPRVLPVQKGFMLLQLNIIIIFTLTFLHNPLLSLRLSQTVQEPWHLWLFTGSILTTKYLHVTLIKSRSGHLKWGYGADLVLNALIGLLLGILGESKGGADLKEGIGFARIFLLALFSGMAVVQIFLVSRVKLSLVSAAVLLSAMTLAEIICFGFTSTLFEHFRLGIRSTFFGLIGLALLNTYLVLTTQFLVRFREIPNNATGILIAYFRTQSDWSFQFWLDCTRILAFAGDIACRDPAESNDSPTYAEAFDPHNAKETSDRVDLSDSDIDDKLSVSALY